MTKYGNLVKGVVTAFMMMGIVACSMVPSPPAQIAQNDHAALAAWYEKEAAHLRQQAKDNAEMEKVYAENPAYAQGVIGGIGKESFSKHCEDLIAMYTKAAEQADKLAKGHRAMVK